MCNFFTLLFSIIIITQSINAQEVDYVMNSEKKKRIKKRSRINSSITPNPDYTSYFLSPTAYTLQKRDIRLASTDLIFMKGSYGLTDNTTISANLSVLGTATGSVKHQIDLSENLKAGLSASAGLIFFFPEDSVAQTPTQTATLAGGEGIITLGDRQNSITFGTGIYHIYDPSDQLSNGTKGWFTNKTYIAVQKQLGRKTYLMAEGIYFTNYNLFTGALGIKFIIKDHMSLNFGLMPLGLHDITTNTTYIVPIAIPLISFRILL